MTRPKITVLTRTAYSIIQVGRVLAKAIGADFIEGKYSPNAIKGTIILVGNPDPYFFFIASRHLHNKQIWYLTTEGPVELRSGIRWYKTIQPYVVANSYYSKECLEKSGLPVDEVVWHGCRFEALEEVPDKSLEFLYCAGYLKRKYPRACGPVIERLGHRLLLITTMNNPYMRDFDLISIYDAPHVKRRYPDRVCTDEMLIELYKSARFYLNLSDTEGFGLTVLEAMAFGAIPIVLNIPPFTEWIPKECAYWFNPTGQVELEPFGAHRIEHKIYTTKALWKAIGRALRDKSSWNRKAKKCLETARKMYYKDVYAKFLDFIM
ncbi:MAG: hypothetical protein DRP01_02520 [Archaeoglobales archaeon]|nr:MAG: hypothetical protein DRP01_02520 [Archaeoglobales archaeon]